MTHEDKVRIYCIAQTIWDYSSIDEDIEDFLELAAVCFLTATRRDNNITKIETDASKIVAEMKAEIEKGKTFHV